MNTGSYIRGSLRPPGLNVAPGFLGASGVAGLRVGSGPSAGWPGMAGLRMGSGLLGARLVQQRAEEQKRMRSAVLASSASLVAETRRARESWLGLSVGQRVLEERKRAREALLGPFVTQRALEEHKRLLDSIRRTRFFPGAMGMHEPIAARIISRHSFSSMVGAATLPGAPWTGVLRDLALGLDSSFRVEIPDGFEGADDFAGSGWWVERLPLPAQLALLVAALQVLDRAGAFVGEVTGMDVPAAYRTGTQVLFSLVVLLLMCIDARARALADDSENN